MIFMPAYRPAAVVRLLEFISITNGSSNSLVLPTDIQNNDIGILLEGATALSSPPADAIATGFSGLVTTTGTTIRIRASYKKLTTGDAGATMSTGLNGTTGNAKNFLLFRPGKSYTTITPSTWLAQVTDGDPTAQTIAASGQVAPLICIAKTSVQLSTPALSFSPAADDTLFPASTQAVAYKLFQAGASPVNITTDATDAGNVNTLLSGYLRLS